MIQLLFQIVFLKDSSGNLTTDINPNFISWKNREQAMFIFINSTLSPAIHALTVGQKICQGSMEGVRKKVCLSVKVSRYESSQ